MVRRESLHRIEERSHCPQTRRGGVFLQVALFVLVNAILLINFYSDKSPSSQQVLSNDEARQPRLQLLQPEVATLNAQESVNGSDAKYLLWSQLKATQTQVLESHQYCMLWCSATDPVFSNKSWTAFYQDASEDEAVLLGSYDQTEDRPVYQRESAEVLNARCCQIATRKSFQVIHDSRPKAAESLDREVTLITFGTYERIQSLVEIQRRWNGPIVFVLYLQDHNDAIFAKKNDGRHLTSAEELARTEQMLTEGAWNNIAVVVYQSKFSADKDVLKVGENANYYNFTTFTYVREEEPAKIWTPEEAAERDLVLLVEFPINTLRNVAQDFAESRFVFAVDLDFIPDAAAHDFFVSQSEFIGSRPKVGIVIPQFGRRKCTYTDREYSYPLDFKALDEQFKSGLVTPFFCDLHYWANLDSAFFKWAENATVGTTCKLWLNASLSHSVAHPSFGKAIELSDYRRWFNNSRNAESDEMYEIPNDELKSKKHLEHYEPYLVLDRVANATHLLMRYNEVFVSRYRDKASWIFGLRMTGYRFFVGKEHFLIHKDHELSPWVTGKGDVAGGPVNRLMLRMFSAADVYIRVLRSLN
eukprot:TRINITY_DN6686_c0_g1_i1.p1 TRINITY_DN6686_c0_g1~~TRINITY_DN6686_c0_g1_i1.p1  ORF type:complete len:586 (-),score=137.32 TRINITY_DN6686_c0_g1_i1:64-1821(-)